MVEIAKNYESSTDAHRLMRQVRGDKSRQIGLTKHPSKSKPALTLEAKAGPKSRLENSLSVPTVE